MDVVEFEGLKIKRLTTYDDGLTQLIQLGAMPAPQLPALKPSFILPAPEATGLSPAQHQTEAVLRYNAHDLVGWAKLISTNADILYGALGFPINRDQAVALQELFFLGFPDLKGEIIRTIDMGGGYVVLETVFRGTHRGPYFGVPATGRSVVIPTAWISRIDSQGLLTYFHCYFDNLGILAQIGAISNQ
jgi:predicted ester cyclase